MHVLEPKRRYMHTFEFKPENGIDDIQIKIPIMHEMQKTLTIRLSPSMAGLGQYQDLWNVTFAVAMC
jgi:subtilisin-like proprotein convertase family protein